MEPKPGWTTSEFWISVGTQVLALLAVFGMVGGGDKTTLETAIKDAVIAAFGLIASAGVVIAYIWSRVKAKTQDLPSPRPRM